MGRNKIFAVAALSAVSLLAMAAFAAGPIVPISPQELAQAVKSKAGAAQGELPVGKPIRPVVTPEMRFKAQLDRKDVEINALKEKLAGKEQELQAMQKRLDDMLAEQSRGADIQVKKMITVIKSLKATEAADVLRRLKKEEALDILGRLDQRTLAKVLPSLEKDLSTDFVRKSMYPGSQQKRSQ